MPTANWLTSSRCADVYVDDTDTYADHNGPEHPPTQFDLDEGDIDPADDPATEVIQNLQHSAQTWTSLVGTVGGAHGTSQVQLADTNMVRKLWGYGPP